jgi:hypothetical protein
MWIGLCKVTYGHQLQLCCDKAACSAWMVHACLLARLHAAPTECKAMQARCCESCMCKTLVWERASLSPSAAWPQLCRSTVASIQVQQQRIIRKERPTERLQFDSYGSALPFIITVTSLSHQKLCQQHVLQHKKQLLEECEKAVQPSSLVTRIHQYRTGSAKLAMLRTTTLACPPQLHIHKYASTLAKLQNATVRAALPAAHPPSRLAAS